MIEVLLATAIFGFISILTIGLMNRGLKLSQANLQLTMARNEVTAQSEALRYIHNAYTSSPTLSEVANGYATLWQAVTEQAQAKIDYSEPEDGAACSELYSTTSGDVNNYSFVLNTSALQMLASGDYDGVVIRKQNSGVLEATASFPYIDFDDDGSVNGAYGIWINAVKGGSKNTSGEYAYYEFFIHSCWDSLATEAPTTLDTVVRLYNPDYWAES